MSNVCLNYTQRDGWRSTNDFVKDIHEVKLNQPLSFNHICCRGVAARVGSVHLIDWKLGRKGGARTHPQWHYSVEAHSPRNSYRPPEIHRKSTNNASSSLVNTNGHTMTDDIIPHPHHNHTTHFLKWVHLHTINNLSHTDSLSSHSTWVIRDWTGLEGLCQAYGGGVAKVKGHTEKVCTHRHINRALKQCAAPESQA